MRRVFAWTVLLGAGLGMVSGAGTAPAQDQPIRLYPRATSPAPESTPSYTPPPTAPMAPRPVPLPSMEPETAPVPAPGPSPEAPRLPQPAAMQAPPADPAARPAPQPFPREPGVPDAEATVRGFYAALSRADGERANAYLIPEKRDAGPFEIDSMNRFYGAMREPLQILGIGRLDANLIRVRYAYEHRSGRRCEGAADVTLRGIGDGYLIERIRALNGC